MRAAHGLDQANLSDQTVVWGHSQGGGAALWTGALADRYAPELDIDGVAALAPVGNLLGLVANLPDVTGGSVFASYVAAAYTAEYDDVTFREYIRPGAEVTVREMASRCLAPPGILGSVLTSLALSRDPNILARDPATGAFGKRLAENEPPATISAPLLIGQGGADGLVNSSAQREFVDRLCAADQQVDYRVYAGRDHIPLVEPDSPLIADLIQWTHDRFDGTTVAPGCVESER
jgi:alpha-beta hydrolase superfamily lysophospholipase